MKHITLKETDIISHVYNKTCPAHTLLTGLFDMGGKLMFYPIWTGTGLWGNAGQSGSYLSTFSCRMLIEFRTYDLRSYL